MEQTRIKTSFQDLKLKKGEKATCTDGYPTPHHWTIVVECIKDFELAESRGYLINNPTEFIKIINSNLNVWGTLTNHYISPYWLKIP